MARVMLSSLGWFFLAPYISLRLCLCPVPTSRLRSESIEADTPRLQTINYLTGFGFVTFIQALSVAMCYTVTQDQRGAKVNYMFITIPAQLTPYAMILANLLFPGGAMNMLLQVQGLLAAHLFDFLTIIWPEYGGGRNLIPTPAFVSSAVQAATAAQSRVAAATGLQPADEASGHGSGMSRGPLPDSWRTRGPGQRLG